MDFWQKTRAMGVVLEEFPGCFFAETEPYAFLVLAGEQSAGECRDTVRELCTRLAEALRRQHQDSTAGLGVPVSSPLELPASYAQALRALGLSAWDHEGIVFAPPEEPSRDLLDQAAGWEARAMEFLVQGQWPEGAAAFEEMFRGYRAARADFEMVKDSCCKILTLADHLPACASWRDTFDADITLLRSMSDAEELYQWMGQRLARMGRESPKPPPKGCSAMITKAQEYIRTHYQEDITLQDIAHEVFISPNYLGRLFREQTGCKLGDWLNIYRVDQAKLLLDGSDLKTYEIASRVGFSSYKYFAVCFLKYAGCSAREYRARQREEAQGAGPDQPQ